MAHVKRHAIETAFLSCKTLKVATDTLESSFTTTVIKQFLSCNENRSVFFQINFIIFIHIIKILVSKLQAHQMRYTDYKVRWVLMWNSSFSFVFLICNLVYVFYFIFLHLRLAKSTLTLIPLLGIHQMFFIFLPDETTNDTPHLHITKLFMDLFFSSFQVGAKC